MIKVKIPNDFYAERHYILDILFKDFLGISFEIVIGEQSSGVCIDVPEKGAIYFSDDLFSIGKNKWLTHEMLPLCAKKVELNNLPFSIELPQWIGYFIFPVWNTVIKQEHLFEKKNGAWHLDLDIFGAAFFFLTRCEEYVATTLDIHTRFSASDSFSCRHDLLNRAIVNEYAEILWAVLKFIAPDLKRPAKKFQQLISHDVDIPFDLLFKSPTRLAKSLLGDVLKRNEPLLACRRALLWPAVRSGYWKMDPYNSFEWLWQQSEMRDIRSAFYFMAGRTNLQRDGDYQIEHPAVRAIIRQSAERGHEIGLHPSYESYCNPETISNEFLRLKRVCDEEGVHQTVWGGRQHYLRWSAKETPRHWENSGLQYDSTLGFADSIGFRSGTCYEYRMFDLSRRKTLNLKQRPLLVMDVSLTAPEYMGLESSVEALVKVAEIKGVCQKFSGNFTMLWHNDRLVSEKQKKMYLKCLDN